MTQVRGGASDKGHGGPPAAQPQAGDAHASQPSDEAVVRRTKDGWRVGSADLPDLTSAMVLADLLAADLPEGEAAQGQPPQVAAATAAPPDTDKAHGHGKDKARGHGKDKAHGQPKEPASTETGKLRTTIGQLEHALMARVRVEQAIGVLAERHRIQPRQAFEQLRSAARSRGKRVIDIASDVVASATNPLLQLPDELSRPRPVSRHARQGRGILGSE
jgi:hypothetical protein